MFKILKHIELPYFKDGYTWSICPYSGSLIKDQTNESINNNLPEKISEALKYCNNPYLCQAYDTISHKTIAVKKSTVNHLSRMHRIFIYLSNKRFFLSKIYSNFTKILFPTTSDAMMAISKIPVQREKRGELCLQRALLAIKTSKSFKRNGVLFIGALLPTVNMHAWIIESGTQPDLDDREWILYRPLLAFYYN